MSNKPLSNKPMSNKELSSKEKELSSKETKEQSIAPEHAPLGGQLPSEQQVAQRWDELRAAIRTQWPSLSAEDLSLIDGDSRKLIALVHQKTGAEVSEIEARIDDIAAGSQGLLDRVSRSVQESVAQVGETVAQTGESTMEPLSEAYHAVEARVAASPGAACGIAFGTGLVIGVFAASLLKDANEPAHSSYCDGWW
jgi:ElaB/YqjD/DUF883 family membrane-anchored ribosome-binding protein